MLEADVSDTTRAIGATQKYALYPEGAAGLETRLTPELRQRVEAGLARNQLDAAPLMRLKPWMLANVLALYEAAQAGYMPALAAEASLEAPGSTLGDPATAQPQAPVIVQRMKDAGVTTIAVWSYLACVAMSGLAPDDPAAAWAAVERAFAGVAALE